MIRIGNEISATSMIGTREPLKTGFNTSYDPGHALYFPKLFVMHSFHSLSVQRWLGTRLCQEHCWALEGPNSIPKGLWGAGERHCSSKQPCAMEATQMRDGGKGLDDLARHRVDTWVFSLLLLQIFPPGAETRPLSP